MRPVRSALTLIGLVLTTILLTQLSAQRSPNINGIFITGTVVDISGAPLGSATVILVRDQAVVQTATTAADGTFTFRDVPRGVYELRAQKEGLAPVTMRVAVSDAPVAPLKLWMGVAMRDAAIEVQGGVAAQRGFGGQGGGRGAGPATGVVGGTLTAREPIAAPPPPLAMPVAAPSVIQEGSIAPPRVQGNREAYDRIDDNPFRRVTDEPVSTFSTDVDTASYANVRRFLNEGRLPPPDAVRIEELVNYFRFAYPDARGDAPVSLTTELAPCPWNPKHRLALIGLQAKRQQAETPQRNLVFLLDVSGSMMPPDKLPLVKTAMRMLVDTLTPRDRVAIVVYAGASGLVLPSTPGSQRADIHAAIERLQAGGSTNGASGIQLAYNTAASAFIKGGVNRVILATDGDFNVGITNRGDLTRLIEQERERGIFLSVLGVGTGNLQDATMEELADRGNGNYSYLDSLQEARRVLIEEAGSTLETVAKDVKIQVEFDPQVVGAYRLVGYENRMLKREDFNDDKKDAGELGAGHTVTVLYELIPPGEAMPGVAVDPLVYQQPVTARGGARSNELMTVKVRFKKPDGVTSELMSVPVASTVTRTPAHITFAAAVAQFGMLLRGTEFKGEATYESTRQLAMASRGENEYRSEFVRLIDLAAALQTTRK